MRAVPRRPWRDAPDDGCVPHRKRFRGAGRSDGLSTPSGDLTGRPPPEGGVGGWHRRQLPRSRPGSRPGTSDGERASVDSCVRLAPRKGARRPMARRPRRARPRYRWTPFMPMGAWRIRHASAAPVARMAAAARGVHRVGRARCQRENGAQSKRCRRAVARSLAAGWLPCYRCPAARDRKPRMSGVGSGPRPRACASHAACSRARSA